MSGDPQNFIRTQCPNLWSMLNRKAQSDLPQGLKEYLSGQNAIIGDRNLVVMNTQIGYLFQRLPEKEVRDHYRRDLSAVDSEHKLAELLCEITLTAALSRLSAQKPAIRPKNHSGKSCDVGVVITDIYVYGDSKRFLDPWPEGKQPKRSIAKSRDWSKPPDGARPRSMDIYSKLKDCYLQFPESTMNIIFLFHPSGGDSVCYIRAALFGDAAFFEDGSEIQVGGDGLFAIKEWSNISACAYTRIQNGTVSIAAIWQNPKAAVPVPDGVIAKLKEMGNGGRC